MAPEGRTYVAGGVSTGGQPSAWDRLKRGVGNFFKDPVGSFSRAAAAVGRAFAPTIDYTRSSALAVNVEVNEFVTTVDDVIVTAQWRTDNWLRNNPSSFIQSAYMFVRQPNGDGATHYGRGITNNVYQMLNVINRPLTGMSHDYDINGRLNRHGQGGLENTIFNPAKLGDNIMGGVNVVVGAVDSYGSMVTNTAGAIGNPRAALEAQGARYQQNARQYGVSGANDRVYYGAGEMTPAIALAFTPGAARDFLAIDGLAVNRTRLTGIRAETPLTASGEFVGPLIGKSGFRTSAELADAVGIRYQGFVDEAYSAALYAESRGMLRGNPNTRIGNAVDRAAVRDLNEWLKSESIKEGPNSMVQIDRWLPGPTGSGQYTRPDVRIPGAGAIYDATVGVKFNTIQLNRFLQFSDGNRITIVRPQAINGNVVGSYSIVPR